MPGYQGVNNNNNTDGTENEQVSVRRCHVSEQNDDIHDRNDDPSTSNVSPLKQLQK